MLLAIRMPMRMNMIMKSERARAGHHAETECKGQNEDAHDEEMLFDSILSSMLRTLMHIKVRAAMELMMISKSRMMLMMMVMMMM